VNQFQPIFDKQKDNLNTDATKSYERPTEQLDRMAKMLNENNEASGGGQQRFQDRVRREGL
jgi:hypothetical protein